MKITKKIICSIVTVFFVSALTSCAHSNNPQMENELRFSLDDISEVALSYDEEAITFYEADGSKLVVKEYMTKDKNSYHAEIKQDNKSIHISEGGKPIFKSGFSRYIEVYLPVDYKEKLTVTTTDGNIDLSKVDLKLSSLRIDSAAGTLHLDSADASIIHLSTTSGELDLDNVSGKQIRLETTSGKIKCEELKGAVTYTSTSGDIEVKSAVGAGSYKANNSGTLKVVYSEVTGDLSFFNKNDGINLMLPQDLEFDFEATTKNGSVSTTFQEKIKVENQTTYGTIGSNPTVTIKAETNNGNIRVAQ